MKTSTKRMLVDAAITFLLLPYLLLTYGWEAMLIALLFGMWNFYDGHSRALMLLERTK